MNSPTDEKADENQSAQHSIVSKSLTCLPNRLHPFARRVYMRELLRKMPINIRNRITALKNLQVDYHYKQAEFYREIFNLERKYHEFNKQLYDKREKIVNGELEPLTETPKWNTTADESERIIDLSEFEQHYRDLENLSEDVRGVPNFWLNIFRNSDTLAQIVYEEDVEALKALRDITIGYNDQVSFVLEFHFDANPYFTNSVLTKEYFLKNMVDKECPFGFDGLEIYKCQGCAIDWKENMNLTMKCVCKRERQKNSCKMRTTVRRIQIDSFFNFFNPPAIEADKLDNVDFETVAMLEIDFEIGNFLREEIIPKAVLYFCGDIIDDMDEYDASSEIDETSSVGNLDGYNEQHVNTVADSVNETIKHN